MPEAHAELEARLASLTAELAEARQAVQAEIAARARLDEDLRAAEEELARCREDLQQFAYAASHDLREPLRAIGGFAQLLERRYRGQLDATADQYIDFVVSGVSRMERMIDDLHVYSRVGTHGRPFEPVDCNGLVRKAIADLQTAIAEHSASVAHDDLPTVTGDGRQLARLFQGLIDNAIKFRGDRAPRVHVSASRCEKAWEFSVQDNGIGVDPAHAEKMFVIFRRLHDPEKHPGTGAGLAIAKRIVERHGGRIRLDSEPGAGSTFWFTIPDRAPK